MRELPLLNLRIGPALRIEKVYAAVSFESARIPSSVDLQETRTERAIGFKSLSGPASYAGTYRFEPTPGGTRFIYELHLDPPILWRLAAPVVRSILRRQLRVNLARLKAMLEM